MDGYTRDTQTEGRGQTVRTFVAKNPRVSEGQGQSQASTMRDVAQKIVRLGRLEL